MTELEPTLTKLRMIAQNYRNIGDYETEQSLLDIVTIIVGLEAENARLKAARDVVLEDAKNIAAQLCDARAENTKLRELADLLLLGVDNDMPRSEGLLWSQRVNALARELGIEVGE